MKINMMRILHVEKQLAKYSKTVIIGRLRIAWVIIGRLHIAWVIIGRLRIAWVVLSKNHQSILVLPRLHNNIMYSWFYSLILYTIIEITRI